MQGLPGILCLTRARINPKNRPAYVACLATKALLASDWTTMTPASVSLRPILLQVMRILMSETLTTELSWMGCIFCEERLLTATSTYLRLTYRHELPPQNLHCSNIIWLADTNYRIDLDNASVRAYAEDDALDMLLAADQLNYVMNAGTVFSGYIEGPILFRPTYRYDVGTDNYDTSEKMRTPAWTGTSLCVIFPTGA